MTEIIGMALTIAYVDEEKSERDNFFGDAFDSGLFAEIYLVHPLEKLDDTISELLDLKIDALVSDYRLSDAAPVGYSGEDIVERFQSIRRDFPCFIRTSHEDQALKTSGDVNRVYSKGTTSEHPSTSLFKRISLQVERYQRQVGEWQEELQQLLEVPAETRNASDVERILELDSLLESSVGDDARIPVAVKEALFSTRDDLIAETQKLVDEMKRALGDKA